MKSRLEHESKLTTMERYEFEFLRGYHMSFPHDERLSTVLFFEHIVTGDYVSKKSIKVLIKG